jgi:hypothetical protein
MQAVNRKRLQDVFAGNPRDAFGGHRSHDGEERPARGVFVDPRVFEQQLQVDIEDARRAVGPFDVTPDPEQ